MMQREELKMNVKRIIACVLICVLMLTAAGCGQSGTKSETTEVVAITEGVKAQYTPGTYEAITQGFGGTITVKVTVDADRIVDVIAEADGETEGIGSEALKQLPAQIIEANGTDIEGVTGASYSSSGILEAVENALAQARGEKVASTGVIDGEYVTEVIGHEGLVTVATTFRAGRIEAVTVLKDDETQGIGSYAVERIPGIILESQSINVDGVTGATVTSNAIKQAVSKAIEKANGSLETFDLKMAKAEVVLNEKEENVQVAIMGAGTAGLFAAAQLLEKGVENVVIFEKQDIPGGSMPLTYGGIILTDSEVYNKWGNGSPTYSSWDIMKESYTAYLTAAGKEFNPDFPFMGTMFKKSGEMYDWMVSIGVGFNTLGSGGFSYPVFSPGVYEGGSGYAMQFLVDRIESKGGRIVYGTPVTDLIQDETGRITGLKAEGKDGTKWTVNANAVIIASGSFAKNKELVDQYFEEWSGHTFNTLESLTGDGLVLGMKYGAGIEDMGAEIPGFLASYDSHFELAFMHLTVPGLIVNINGDEFGDIVKMNHQVMSAAKADPSNGDTFYYIFDEAASVQAHHSATYGFDTYKAIFEKGEAKHYESLEACADALNLPNLKITVDTNNELSAKGEPNQWNRKNLPYVDTNEGVWAIRVDPNVYLTTGGLKIDIDSHVLTHDGKIIPGLFAAGDVCGSIEQKDGVTYGYGFVAAMSFGAIAAETISEDLK